MKSVKFVNEGALAQLKNLYRERATVLEKVQESYNSALPVLASLVFDDATAQLELKSLKKKLERIDMEIAHLIRHEHLAHLQPGLDHIQKFYTDPDRHVFVMTKFPATSPSLRKDVILTAILEQIVETCRESFGLTAVIASTRNHGGNIWENAQVHCLACTYGIAVLENKHTDEFNPNVAMEAGFMSALGKNVMLLVEDSFPPRADIQGRICYPFHWGDADPDLESVASAVRQWLDNQGLSRIPGK